MEVNELRIGNWIACPLNGMMEIRAITGIAKRGVWNIGKEVSVKSDSGMTENIYFNLDECEDIPLTEEWLLKFGFEETDFRTAQNDMVYIKLPGRNQIHKMAGSWMLSRWNKDSQAFDYISTMEFVHQLQNFYFYFTREELTVS